MRNLVYLLLLPVGAYVVICLLLFAGQRSHIYYPVRESNPEGAQYIRMQGAGADLKVWVVRRPGPRAIIYFGGNAEDVAYNLGGFAAAFPGHSLYLVNYRGYGGSSGEPTESGLTSDAVAVFDEVTEQHSVISVIGRSLGSGVAAHLASVRDVHRLVLVTPFDSLVNVAGAHFRYFPVSLLMRDRYDAGRLVPSIRAPVLIIIAANDEIIPRARSDALAAAFGPARARVTVLEDVGHNDIDGRPQYLESVAEFLGDGVNRGNP
ncbi:MAG TPA: alpha/beta hydrolase [Steroidobacteraceae bacterium]|nr:alpha/beta hydrolase [Steroidobacteraceae bacterium]